jgi:hypothetical protein
MILSNRARIEAVLTDLENRGILSRADFQDCNTCAGERILNQELPAWGDRHVSGPEHQPIGYMFFHEQATDSANHGGPLLLSHGSFSEADDSLPEEQVQHDQRLVASMIVEEFREHGFDVEWSGDLWAKIPVVEPRGGWHLDYDRDEDEDEDDNGFDDDWHDDEED